MIGGVTPVDSIGQRGKINHLDPRTGENIIDPTRSGLVVLKAGKGARRPQFNRCCDEGVGQNGGKLLQRLRIGGQISLS